MQIISGTTQFRIEEGTAVAIGKFDGLHLGHRKLLREILRQKEDGLKAAVFTFDPSPEVFFGMNPARELSTNEEKRELFREIGIDILVEFPFNKATAAITPERFVIDILCGMMNAKFVAAGTDLSFGAMGKGNFSMLSSLARHLGFETCKIDKIERNGKVISSTLIRGFVEEGNMEDHRQNSARKGTGQKDRFPDPEPDAAGRQTASALRSLLFGSKGGRESL